MVGDSKGNIMTIDVSVRLCGRLTQIRPQTLRDNFKFFKETGRIPPDSVDGRLKIKKMGTYW